MADTQAISDLLKRATDAGDVPGVVVAAATADGPIFVGGSGVRDVTSGTPMTPDTVVWIASMTKAVTGACAMQLVEQGRLSLDEPIATVLPELGQDAGARRLRRRTARHGCDRHSGRSRCAIC